VPKEFFSEEMHYGGWDECRVSDFNKKRLFDNNSIGISLVIELSGDNCVLTEIRIYPKIKIE